MQKVYGLILLALNFLGSALYIGLCQIAQAVEKSGAGGYYISVYRYINPIAAAAIFVSFIISLVLIFDPITRNE